MQAIPRPAPRVAPATSALCPSSGRPAAGFFGFFLAGRIAHLLDRSGALGLPRPHAPRGLLHHARKSFPGKLGARPNLDVAHRLPAALEESLGIAKTRAFTESQVHVLCVAD